MNKRLVGSAREEQAAAFLRGQGMQILFRNYRCRVGEIDLIARDGDTLVFVEVKYRYSDRYGWGEEHVGKKKQATIYKVAQHFLNQFGTGALPPCRFDVVAVDQERILHFPNAFER